jgi:BirA family biotin operon repressor/biotin-[acetyl-CoA-carboxylase] ligase
VFVLLLEKKEMKVWRNDLLETLSRAGEEFQSGEDLAKWFGCSRTAIWKGISILRKEGYPIEAVTNRGYRLLAGSQRLQREIDIQLQKRGMQDIFRVHVEDVVLSTNLQAREAGVNGCTENEVFVAILQTQGRGRLGRTWESEANAGLWFSVLLRPDMPQEKTPLISLFWGLCAMKSLHSLYSANVGIKWPNDIISLANGKKLCGILSETHYEDNKLSFAIVGCGVNLLQRVFPESIAEKATSLYLEGVLHPSRAELLAEMLQIFWEEYPKFIISPEKMICEYRANCATIGREVRLESEASVCGIAQNITEQGELEILSTTGKEMVISAGEVSVRGMLGYI